MPEATPPKAAMATKVAPAAKDAKCAYCGERLRGVPANEKDPNATTHPGGPNACIARALLKLRRSLRTLQPKK